MAKAKTKAATHFVVERFNWRRSGNTPSFHRLPGFSRIQSFDTREDADAFRHAEELKARAVVNPFLGTLAPPTDQTDLPEHALHDWYMDHDITPPKPDKKGGLDWAKWWAKEAKKWKGDRAAVAWEPLHKVQFYRIVERPKAPVVYALVEVNWGYNDEWYYPDAEGGRVTTVYRSRAKALAECERETGSSIDVWEDIAGELGFEEAGANQFELNDRVLPGRSPFDPPPTPEGPTVDDGYGDDFGTFTAAEVPFYEVIEIELEGLE